MTDIGISGEQEENRDGEPSPTLTFEEARVLGCLIEKEISTPEHYPLTMNAVVAACNQKSNRDPVVGWDEPVVDNALAGLRRKRFAVMISMAGARVPKYKHTIESVWGALDAPMTAILCELLLRNGQSFGELRTRAGRLHPFASLEAVEEAVNRLVEFGVEPLAAILPPGMGRRVKTVFHTLCGPPDPGSAAAPAVAVIPPPDDDWRTRMESEVASLRAAVEELRGLVRGDVDPPADSAAPPG